MEAKKGWFQVESVVSNTEKDAAGKGKRVAIGKVKMNFVGAEILKDLFAGDITVKEMGEDGLPIYNDDRINVIVDLVNAKIDQRNKSYLVPGTVELMAGKNFVEDLTDLISDGSGKGEGAKRRHECIAALAAYVRDQGRSEQIVNMWVQMFSQPKGLIAATQKYKDAALQYLSGFASTLTEEQLVRYSTTMASIEEAANTALAEEDVI